MAANLNDLNDHLFTQLERLSREGMTPDDLEHEAKRAASIVSLADQITKSSDMRLKAAKLFAEHGKTILPMLPQIGGKVSE